MSLGARNRSFSQSHVWSRQREVYEALTTRAWNGGGVPEYITTNPWFAGSFARFIAAAFAQARGGEARRARTVVEVGCGSGRFAASFLDALARECASSSPEPWHAVLTDVVASNVEHLGDLPAIRRFVRSGNVECETLDVERDPLPVARAAWVVATYVLDSMPVDLFMVSGGRLYELLVDDDALADDYPGALHRLSETATRRACDATTRYPHEGWNRALAACATRAQDAVFALPVGAFGILDRIPHGAPPAGILFADYGTIVPSGPDRGLVLQPSIHGTFSFGVDFDAVRRYAEGRGGRVLTTSHRSSSLHAVFVALGGAIAAPVEAAFGRSFETTAPDDFHVVQGVIRAQFDTLSLRQLLAWVRFSDNDPHQFLAAMNALAAGLASATRGDLDELRSLVAAARQRERCVAVYPGLRAALDALDALIAARDDELARAPAIW
jgi:hypothetical protein